LFFVRRERIVSGQLGQVAAELVEQLGGLLALARASSGAGARVPLALATTARAGEHPDHLVADLLRVRVEVEQDAGGDALVLTHQPEQDVLGADVVVAEAQRLAQRELEDLLRARSERNLAGGDLLAGADDPNDLSADALDRDVEALEHSRGKTLLLAEESKQDVLGADVVVLEGSCLFLGEDHHLPGPLCESLEHLGYFLPAAPGALSVELSGSSRLATAKRRGCSTVRLYARSG
jgi:hypothetical protein